MTRTEVIDRKAAGKCNKGDKNWVKMSKHWEKTREESTITSRGSFQTPSDETKQESQNEEN